MRVLNPDRFRAALAAAIFALIAGCQSPPETGADLVLTNGPVYTVDDDRSWAEAVAVTDGEIVFVGAAADAQSLISDNTEVVDLEGKMLLPGFHDAHAHVRYGGTAMLECSLQGTVTVGDIRAGLADCAATMDLGEDEWVLGGGWPLSAFPDGIAPASILDEIFGNRPAYFGDAFGHNSWANSRAMELAGITADTPDPIDGLIERDPETGEPIGTFRESAQALFDHVIPEETDEQRYEGLLNGIAEANSLGITAYIEPGTADHILGVYKRVDDEGKLSARVLAAVSPIGALPGSVGPELFDLIERREQYRGTNLDVDAVKIYIDGVIETKTSVMLEPYLDGSNVEPFYEQQELNELYQRLDELGLQIHTHAIGDGAIRIALNAYEYTIAENGPNDNRHLIVHLQLIDEDDIPRFAELNVAANYQSYWSRPDVYIDVARDVVGDERVDRFYTAASVERAGGLLVGGSDWDVSTLNPLEAIEVAVRRQEPDEGPGEVLGVNEELSLQTAIDMYTRNASYIMSLEDLTGTIEVGKRADLVVLDRNLFEITDTEINEARVLRTILDGETVYVADTY